MGMQAVVMLEPRRQLRQDRLCIGKIAKGHIVSFKGFHKAISHAAGLRTYNTGMRHGTEALGICWNLIEWHTQDGKRCLRIWVDGKTGGRWLIAKRRAIEPLQRLHQRQPKLAHLSFDGLLQSGCRELLFKTTSGYQPHRIDGTFRRLLRDAGLLKDSAGQTRTLYSLRHTYATLELLTNTIDIHTLSKQLGNSAAMIERHYSKLTATMAAERFA